LRDAAILPSASLFPKPIARASRSMSMRSTAAAQAPANRKYLPQNEAGPAFFLPHKGKRELPKKRRRPRRFPAIDEKN
jgi:hypothetical protein